VKEQAKRMKLMDRAAHECGHCTAPASQTATATTAEQQQWAIIQFFLLI